MVQVVLLAVFAAVMLVVGVVARWSGYRPREPELARVADFWRNEADFPLFTGGYLLFPLMLIAQLAVMLLVDGAGVAPLRVLGVAVLGAGAMLIFFRLARLERNGVEIPPRARSAARTMAILYLCAVGWEAFVMLAS